MQKTQPRVEPEEIEQLEDEILLLEEEYRAQIESGAYAGTRADFMDEHYVSNWKVKRYGG